MAPRPPYSAGHPRQVHPPSASTFSQRRRTLEAERLVTRAAPAPELGELAHQVLVEEAADLLAEGHVLGPVSQIHRPWSVAKAQHMI